MAAAAREAQGRTPHPILPRPAAVQVNRTLLELRNKFWKWDPTRHGWWCEQRECCFRLLEKQAAECTTACEAFDLGSCGAPLLPRLATSAPARWPATRSGRSG